MLRRIVVFCTGAMLSVLVLGGIAWADHDPYHQDVTVDAQRVTVGPYGSVTVSGTIVCEGSFYIDSYVRQKAGRQFNDASGSTSGVCLSGEPTPWQITMRGNGQFRKGSALVDTYAYAYGYDPVTGTYREGYGSESEELRVSR